MARSLDGAAEASRSRPLDGGSCRYLWLDALAMQCRDDDRIVSVSVVVAVGIDSIGPREALGLALMTTQDDAASTAFLRVRLAPGAVGCPG